MSTSNENRIWTGPFILVLMITLFNGGIGMMTTPLVTEFALSVGADLTMASTTAGVMSLVSLFVCPFAGLLTDRVNRKKLLIYCNIGYAVCLAFHAAAANIVMLLICRICTGFFFSIISVTIIAFSSNYIPKKRMAEGLGYTSVASVIAQAAGPGLGMYLMDHYSIKTAFMAAAAVAVGCILILAALPHQEEEKKTVRRKIEFKDIFASEFVYFMLLAALFSGGNGLLTTYLKTIARERSIANISLFYTVYPLVMLVLRPSLGKLQDRIGVYRIVIPAILFAALGMVSVGFGHTITVMLFASVCKAFGQGSGTPSLQAHAVKKLDRSRSGVAVSTIQIGQNLGNALAPIAGSFVVTAYNFETMFSMYAILIVAAGFVLLYAQNRREQRK